jgi:nucleoid-associated protein YgaU
MSVRRLVFSVAALAAIGELLSVLTPALPAMTEAVAHAQRTADTAGPDALMLAAAGLLAWAVWLWGAVGLGLTALAAAPGLLGATSSVVLRLVLPSAARRGAAGLLGVSLSVVPLIGTASASLPTIASAAGPITATATATATGTGTATASPAVPDWPTAAPVAAVPDWPSRPPSSGTSPARASDAHVVLRGECLWDIAAGRLGQGRREAPTDGEIARAVSAWWSVNTAVIGSDPDRLLPGQVLSPPVTP